MRSTRWRRERGRARRGRSRRENTKAWYPGFPDGNRVGVDRNALLPHFERSLGPYCGEGVAEPEWNVPFSAFRWPDAPEPGVSTLVTFGLARHLFAGRRQELLLALRPVWDEVALSILVSVGMYALDRHAPLNVGETVRIPEELDTPVQRLAVVPADELAPGLGLCREYEPPVEVLWLIPQDGDDRFELGDRHWAMRCREAVRHGPPNTGCVRSRGRDRTAAATADPAALLAASATAASALTREPGERFVLARPRAAAGGSAHGPRRW